MGGNPKSRSKMSTRLFEEKEHASFYQKFRFKPSQEIIDLMISYVDEKLPKPHGLAVDAGCGSGQGTRFLSPYFGKVLGIDISEAQIEEAKKSPGLPNVTFSVGPAEEMPVDDVSVDLLTTFAAVHWFDIGKFLKEVDRILKPRGCLAFYTYSTNVKIHYKDHSEEFPDVVQMLAPYMHEKFRHLETNYDEIFEAIPYTDKKRMEQTITKIPMPLSGYMGFIQSSSAFQIYKKIKPKKAKEWLETLEKRFLQIMGTSSSDTEVEVWLENILVLASKPQ